MEVRVLGPVEVRDGTTRVVPLAPRLQRLVAALALAAPGSASVEDLMEAVWGEVAPPTANKAIHGLVSSLRAAAGASVVDTVDGGYRLGSSVQIDRVRFDQLAQAALGAGGNDPTDVDRALGLWRGRPFPGLDDMAVRAESARLEETRQQLEETRASRLIGASPGAAVATLERLVAEAPLRERRWSLLVEALVVDGRVAEALRTYERARRLLADEVGAAPGPALDAAYRSALDAPAGAADHRVVDVGWVRPPPPLPFVGRDALADELADRCRAVESLGAVVLAGEPGVGKTRLMEEVARLVTGDAAVLFGACDPGVRDGLGPLRSVMSRLVGLISDEVLERLDVTTAESLGRIVPGLTARLGLAGPRPVDPETDRARLADAVVAAVRIVTRSGPTLLVLDDLHWADDDAVALLGRVLGGLRDEPLLVLAGHRHVEPDRNPALVDWLDSVATQGRVEQVALAGLTTSDLVHLLDRLGSASGHDPERLWSATAGNPFFVGQVLSVGERAGPTEAVQAVVERHL
ncbi:MAG: AAA family ATPase, partial [Acidimicrobiales bacterium]|nr:AAA family ATPase [Acidimicrobiales bacterium]